MSRPTERDLGEQAMNDSVSESVLNDDHRIAYGRHGAGEPVILVHGTPSYSYEWQESVPGLADAGYEVYTRVLVGDGQFEVVDNVGLCAPGERLSGGVTVVVSFRVDGGKVGKGMTRAGYRKTGPDRQTRARRSAGGERGWAGYCDPASGPGGHIGIQAGG